jgi:hypothetical protein
MQFGCGRRGARGGGGGGVPEAGAGDFRKKKTGFPKD